MRKLVLENGMVFEGNGFGAHVDVVGEVVFTTGMTGYQQTLSDLSFNQQILVFTYPLIGNYGINDSDFEAQTAGVAGVIVAEENEDGAHWEQQSQLGDYLAQQGVAGVSGIDTRQLTRLLREHGTVKGVICDVARDTQEVLAELQVTTFSDHVACVSTKEEYVLPGDGAKIVLVDYGVKKGILTALQARRCQVCVVPHNTPAAVILAKHPDGVLLSNGPGDPAELQFEITQIQQLIGKVPLFGICLGHQLYAHAKGATTYKLLFGHRGANHPVLDLQTKRVHISSQNHSYAVAVESLEGTGLMVTHRSLNDESVEGLADVQNQAFTVQFHPEAQPGPDDSSYLFDLFLAQINGKKEAK